MERAVASYAALLRKEHPEVERIIWFGSWVSGLPAPGSDVDLCVIVNETSVPERERRGCYFPDRFPTGLDLFVYTRGEFERLATLAPGWKRAILSGREL